MKNIPAHQHFFATWMGHSIRGKRFWLSAEAKAGLKKVCFSTRFASQADIVEYKPQVKASQLLPDKVAEMRCRPSVPNP